MLSDEQVEITRPRGEPWNPLGDDGDALRLAVKLGLDIMTRGDHGGAYAGAEERGATASAEDNHCAAIRHAIVRVAAEIGHTMSEYLTPLELHQLTGYARSGQQRDALDAALAAPVQVVPAPGVDAVSEREFKQFLSDVLTAAGLVTHGKKCKDLGRRLGEMSMRLLTAPKTAAAPVQAQDALKEIGAIAVSALETNSRYIADWREDIDRIAAIAAQKETND